LAADARIVLHANRNGSSMFWIEPAVSTCAKLIDNVTWASSIDEGRPILIPGKDPSRGNWVCPA
jgi:hypothetical protein